MIAHLEKDWEAALRRVPAWQMSDPRSETEMCLTRVSFGHGIHEAQARSTMPGSMAKTILPKC